MDGKSPHTEALIRQLALSVLATGGSRDLADDLFREIVKVARAQGFPMPEIAAWIGMNTRSIYRWLSPEEQEAVIPPAQQVWRYLRDSGPKTLPELTRWARQCVASSRDMTVKRDRVRLLAMLEPACSVLVRTGWARWNDTNEAVELSRLVREMGKEAEAGMRLEAIQSPISTVSDPSSIFPVIEDGATMG